MTNSSPTLRLQEPGCRGADRRATCLTTSSESLPGAQAERRARNQVVYRMVNDRILDVNDTFGEWDHAEFLCECGNPSCETTVEMTGGEYGAVRAQSTLLPDRGRSPRAYCGSDRQQGRALLGRGDPSGRADEDRRGVGGADLSERFDAPGPSGLRRNRDRRRRLLRQRVSARQRPDRSGSKTLTRSPRQLHLRML